MAGIWLVPVVHLPDPGHLPDEELRSLVAPPLEALAGLVARFPGFRASVHLPGRFLGLADHVASKVLAGLRTATQEGRLEWLGGGYHDPLFPLLPPAWRQTQIQMLDQSLRQRLQARPRGVWLTESVWDPGLIPDLFQAGFEYTILKDYQVLPGLGAQTTGGWVLTEELACPLKILLSQESLGALFRAGALEDMLRLLQGGAGDQPTLGVFDLPLLSETREGLVPLFAERLSQLCELCAQDPTVEMQLAATVIDRTPLLTTACVAASTARGFCSGGPGGGVRDLLRRHPFANRHHKTALQLLSRLDQVASPKVRAEGAEYLQRAMNAGFFRGAEEGAGLSRLRDRLRVTGLLLKAEALLDEHQGDDSVRVDATDLLCSGSRQVIVRHMRLGCLIEPGRGGRISSLQHKPRCHDWGLCLGPDATAPFAAAADATRSSVLLEHFLSPDGVEVGDFQNAPFDVQYKKNGKDLQIVMGARQEVTGWPVRVEKAITLRAGKSTMTVTWKITNVAGALVSFRFALESNVSPGEPDPRQRHKLSKGDWAGILDPLSGEDVKTYLVEDRNEGVFLEWNFNKPASCQVTPVQTPSPMSPGGQCFQGVCVWPSWDVRLDTGESWSLITRFDLGSLRRKS